MRHLGHTFVPSDFSLDESIETKYLQGALMDPLMGTIGSAPPSDFTEGMNNPFILPFCMDSGHALYKWFVGLDSRCLQRGHLWL